MPTKKTREPARERQGSREIRFCKVPDCGRPAYARGLCQTHHRQLRTRGKVKPIRPYRKRSPGTVKFAGLRLSAHCAGRIEQKAREEGLSMGATIAAILEDWVERTHGS